MTTSTGGSLFVLCCILISCSAANILSKDDDESPHGRITSGPPVFMHPEDMTQYRSEIENSTGVLHCAVQGELPMWTEWIIKTGDDELAKSSISYVPGDVEGTTMVIVKSAKVAISGNYTCVVSNRLGSVNHTMFLNIYRDDAVSAPVIKAMSANVTVKAGEDVKFRCSILSRHYFGMQWTKNFIFDESFSFWEIPLKNVLQVHGNSEPLNDLGRIKSEDYEYVIKSASPKDAGWYTCWARNMFGSAGANAYLHVIDGGSPATTNDKCEGPVDNTQDSLHRKLDLLIDLLQRREEQDMEDKFTQLYRKIEITANAVEETKRMVTELRKLLASDDS